MDSVNTKAALEIADELHTAIFAGSALAAETMLRSLAAERDALSVDAERYRWLRTAGAWESEVCLTILSEDPAEFDAAVDRRMAFSARRLRSCMDPWKSHD